MEIKKKITPNGHFFYRLDDEGIGKPIQAPLFFIDKEFRLNVQAFKDTPTKEAGEFFTESIQDYINYCFLYNDLEFLDLILHFNLLPAQEIDHALEKMIEEEQYEMQVMLIKYKDKINGYEQSIEESIEDRFSL